jgi:hypothetical protein
MSKRGYQERKWRGEKSVKRAEIRSRGDPIQTGRHLVPMLHLGKFREQNKWQAALNVDGQ